MIFNPDGSINAERSLTLVERRLGKLTTQPLASHLLRSALTEGVQLVLAPDVVSSTCSFIEEHALLGTSLVESNIPLSCVGERSLEWEFFQDRKETLPDDPKAYAFKHFEASRPILQNIRRSISSFQTYIHDNGYQIFMRCKSIPSTLRKMRSKGLRSWEIGDYLGFAICPPNFREMAGLAACIDRDFAKDILYKQNGFADRIVYRRDLSGFRGRRIFYIIRLNDVVCFEVQVITLRQLIFVHLDHSRYIGRPHTSKELESLELFGNNAYLLDLLELAGGL